MWKAITERLSRLAPVVSRESVKAPPVPKAPVPKASVRKAPVWKVSSSAEKGLGLFATEDVPRYAIIMREPRAFTLFKNENTLERYMRFLQLPPATQESVLGLKASHSKSVRWSPHIIRLVSGGMDERLARPMMHLNDILATNAFGQGNRAALDPARRDTLAAGELPPRDSVRAGGVRGGIYVNPSRMNHSCTPNTIWTSHYGSTDLVVVATCGIRAGEEITTSYIENLALYKTRQQDLSDHGFECACPVCEPRGRASYDKFFREFTDAHRDRLLLRMLKQGSDALSSAELEEALGWAQKRIRIINRRHGFVEQKNACYQQACRIVLALYKREGLPKQLDEAIKYMDHIVEIENITMGPDSPYTERSRKLQAKLREGDVDW